MKRKFSFDLPARLKIGPLRPDAGKNTWKESSSDPFAPYVESQPPTPKSVRPPLPGDLDAELRAACTWIVTHPKPSHERWDNSSKPALDYRAIKYAEAGPISSMPALGRRHSARSKEPSRVDLQPDSTKYSYRPNAATEELFKPGDATQKNARSRVDQLMAPEAPKVVVVTGTGRHRSGSHSHSQATATQPHAHANASTKPETGDRKRASARSDSIGTSGSTPHTDSTEYPWSASTAMTSAVMTPARSKRTSSQAIGTGADSGNVPKVDAVNAEWMRFELEKHYRGQQKSKQTEQEEPALCTATYVPSGDSPYYCHDYSRVPARKPVPSRAPSKVSHHGAGQNMRERGSPTRRGRMESTEQEGRGRSPPRSYSRLGKASRAASRAASVAAGRAGSIANEIFIHLDLRTGQPSQVPTEPPRRSASKAPSKAPSRSFSRAASRPPSRARSISRHVKEYFRPGSSMSMRQESVASGRSGAAPSEEYTERDRSRGWRILSRGRSTFDLSSRPGSSGSRLTVGETHSPRCGKPAVDLNRELPPLPGLDKWESAQTEPDRSRPRSSAGSTLTRALSKMDIGRGTHVARMATNNQRHQAVATHSTNHSSPTISNPQQQSIGQSLPNTNIPSRIEQMQEVERRRFRGASSSEHSLHQPPQRVPRPQTHGAVPASNRNGFIDADSVMSSSRYSPALNRKSCTDSDAATLNSTHGHARDSYFHAPERYGNENQRSARTHQRSPTLDEKARRKWWQGNLKRSSSQTLNRMDSVIRLKTGMPLA